MTLQVIDTITAQPNGKQGEPIRTAFQKANSNFDELYARTGGPEALPPGAKALLSTGNLADLADVDAARENLGVGEAIAGAITGLGLGTASKGNLQKLSCDYFGSVEPADTWPGFVWADSGTGWSKRRNEDGDAWVNEFELFTELAKKIGDPNQRFKVAPSVDLDDATNRNEVFGQFEAQSGAPPSVGVIYTNTIGRARILMIEGSASGGGSYVHMQVSGRFAGINYAPATGNVVSCWALVPRGKTFLITQQGLSSHLVSEFV